VARLIEEHFGVSYHPGHVWRVMRLAGWSCQKPVRRAVERDEAAIEQWKKQKWPRIKKKPVPSAG
jgi:transposase